MTSCAEARIPNPGYNGKVNLSFIHDFAFDMNLITGELNGGQTFANFTIARDGYDPMSGPPGNPIYEKSKQYIQGIVIPIVCTLGIIGNILSMVVLTQKRLKSFMDSMERSAYLGMFSLAVSDMLFCLVALPHGIYPDMHTFYTHRGFWIYYKTFGMHLINVFMMCSTWLTVLMAVTRYLGICHPLQARRLVDVTWTKIAVVLIFLMSFILNLPRFWEFKIVEMCIGEKIEYYIDSGYFSTDQNFYWASQYLWAILGNFIPLLILIGSNICLIQAFRASTRVRRQCLVRGNYDDPLHNRITPTLIVIVLMFIILVSPSEIIHFFYNILLQTTKSEEYMLADAIMTVMVTINFSFNFILYCTINAHFRRVLKGLVYRISGRNNRITSRSFASGSTKVSIPRSAMVETEL